MEKKSKKIMFIAIVAVVIFAFPISFYEFPNKPVPISVTDGFAAFNWRYNFSKNYGTETVLPSTNQTQSTAIFSSSGYPNSSLSIALSSCEFSVQGPMNIFESWINVSGSLTSNLHPKNLVISETVKAYSAEKGGFFNFSDPYVALSRFCPPPPFRVFHVNLSEPTNNPVYCIAGTGTVSSGFNLLNDSFLAKSTIYHFDFYRFGKFRPIFWSDFCFLPQSLNITYYVYITAELTGLSKPVFAQVELIIQNVQE
ncbi:MAG: hypothetical protein M1306_05855 [Candidatus Thermoplasmatota archaeon]|jgi:hypothetical protein|nr:hypothetical protein [Candidatus Thermoplasmatota archaeon]